MRIQYYINDLKREDVAKNYKKIWKEEIDEENVWEI